jgi:hypothetical protein
VHADRHGAFAVADEAGNADAVDAGGVPNAPMTIATMTPVT